MAELAARKRLPLPATPMGRDLIRYATVAANRHNTQPWRFRETAAGIDILPDLSRRTPVVDPDDHHLFVNLGCATDNLSLAMAAQGQGGEITVDPERAIHVAFGTFRSPDTAQMADPVFVAELKHWLRFSPHAAMTTGDGLYSAASGSPSRPDWLGPHLFDIAVATKSETAKYARQIASSSGIAVFAGASATPTKWVQVGRACQRFALQATALGLKLAFLHQPVEVAGFRAELAALAGLPGRRPDIVMRFGRAAAMPWSVRKPVEAVMA